MVFFAAIPSHAHLCFVSSVHALQYWPAQAEGVLKVLLSEASQDRQGTCWLLVSSATSTR